jgi:hypothetical protein
MKNIFVLGVLGLEQTRHTNNAAFMGVVLSVLSVLGFGGSESFRGVCF